MYYKKAIDNLDSFLIKNKFTLVYHNSHNRISNSLAKKREPSKYNLMKACDGYWLSKYNPCINRPRHRYLFIHECEIHNYTIIPHTFGLGEPWGCLTSANVRLEWHSHSTRPSIKLHEQMSIWTRDLNSVPPAQETASVPLHLEPTDQENFNSMLM